MRRTIVRDEVLQSDLIAIADDKGNRITYRELVKEAEELSRYMDERSLVFILCDHQMETAKFIYEILYLNRVPLLLSDDMGMEFIHNLIAVYKPQYIYCRRDHEIGNEYYREAELDKHIVLKTGKERYKIHPDVALLLSTSGTTGSPKLVKLSYDNLYHNAENVCSLMEIHSGQRGITPLSISYVYGLTFCLWHWHCGATLLMTEESVLSNKFREFYEREKAENFAGTPYIYQMLLRIHFWDSEKIKNLHWAMSSGSQMPEKDQINMVSLMKEKFWIMYGQTECTGVIAGMNYNEENVKLSSVGRVFDTVKIEIDEKECELVLKSVCISMGYAQNEKELAEGNINQGTLHTGDVAHIDNEGCIYLLGRLTRYVKILGKRVSLDGIEGYLNNKYPDAEFACIGRDDELSVFHTKPKEDMEKKIKVLLDSNMKIPKKYISCFYLEEIPRYCTGKIMYISLEKLKNERKNIGNM